MLQNASEMRDSIGNVIDLEVNWIEMNVLFEIKDGIDGKRLLKSYFEFIENLDSCVNVKKYREIPRDLKVKTICEEIVASNWKLDLEVYGYPKNIKEKVVLNNAGIIFGEDGSCNELIEDGSSCSKRKHCLCHVQQQYIESGCLSIRKVYENLMDCSNRCDTTLLFSELVWNQYLQLFFKNQNPSTTPASHQSEHKAHSRIGQLSI
eukprot:CAMPEP_0182444854 /NCGR_PEP_ID=MMETSP1172-20130603/3173_1 /TAXON_ID=708627 /ORGANISM="Timspurckia oligopyrenoides, Strain CCMP3278" /LENGTH=205 /DNA_ID=CAMNT_0024640501 /DNA_START=587 /DNA_END=1204 /DNA_ORIENTATION=-